LPVYSTGTDAGLAEYLGLEVVVIGKLVDFKEDESEKELWTGAIMIDDAFPL
jgi:hypothetical protein